MHATDTVVSLSLTHTPTLKSTAEEGEKRKMKDRPTNPIPPLPSLSHNVFHFSSLHFTCFVQGQASMRSLSWAEMESRSPIADGADHVMEVVGMLGGLV